MAYTRAYPGGWKDKPDPSTPIDAAVLTHIEDAIAATSTAVDAIPASFVTYDGTNLKQNGAVVPISTGGAGSGFVAASGITDSTAVGRAVVTAADAAAARTAIGAGTSNLAIGTTSTTAKAGNYAPASVDITDATAAGRALLTAADAAAQRTALGVSTGGGGATINDAAVTTTNTWSSQNSVNAGGSAPAFLNTVNLGTINNPLNVRTAMKLDGFQRAVLATEKTYVEAVLGGGATRFDPASAKAWAKTQAGCTGIVLPPLEELILNRVTADALSGEGLHLGSINQGDTRGFDIRGYHGMRDLTVIRAADNIAPPMHFEQKITLAGSPTGSVKFKAGAVSSGAVALSGITSTTIQTAIRAMTGCATSRVFGSGTSFTIFWDPGLASATAFTLDVTGVTTGTVTTATSSTLEYHLMLCGVSGKLSIKDLTIHAGTQSNDINILRVTGDATAEVKRVKLIGGFGSSNFPTGEGSYETTMFHSYKATGGTYEDIDIDGLGTAALAWGNSNSVGTYAAPIKAKRIRSYRTKASHGVSLYQSGYYVIEDFEAWECGTTVSGSQSGIGLNIEQPYGYIRVLRPNVRDCSDASYRILTSETVGASSQRAPVAAGTLLPARRDIVFENAKGRGAPYGILLEGTAKPPTWLGVCDVTGETAFSPVTGIVVPSPFDLDRSMKPVDVVAESMSRVLSHPNSTQAMVSGTRYLGAIQLPQDAPIKRLEVDTNGTASVTPTHFWMELFDADGNLLAVTADNGSTAWSTTQAPIRLALAKDGTGAASSSFTPTYSGLYYIGVVFTGTGSPTLLTGNIGGPLNSLTNQAPGLWGTGATGLTTYPTTFGYTDTIAAALGGYLYSQARI